MHIKSAKLFIRFCRYFILTTIIITNFLFHIHKTYSVLYSKKINEIIIKNIYVKNLNEIQYDSLINSLPATGYAKENAISNTHILYYGFIPYWILNIIYSIYIYYLVLLVINIIIVIKKMKNPIKKLV